MQVYKTLSSLATRCRANQAEIFSLVISKVEEAENGFVSKRDDILETSIEELRNIASASPGNVMAATNVAKAFSAPMLAALFDKRDELLRREGMFPTTAPAPPGEIGPSEATELSTADAQGISLNDDIKTIQAQNNTLRASVAQLRKKNAEVCLSCFAFLTTIDSLDSTHDSFLVHDSCEGSYLRSPLLHRTLPVQTNHQEALHVALQDMVGHRRV